MKRRDFVKNSAAVGSIALLSSCVPSRLKKAQLRTAHIGVGGMGLEDLKAMASHDLVKVTALCDVDSINLAAAKRLYPKAKIYKDYRVLLTELSGQIDAVVVSTPDHMHAPISMMAMEMGKAVYCQKPLTHHVSEARAMAKLAKEKQLVTQMGIQVHSFYDYILGTVLIQSGIVGKVHTVHAWSPKNWGYDGEVPTGSDPVPAHLDWNLWLGTAAERPYKEGMYHPMNWRKICDYGCGTFGDMGVHIFDTPYNALALDVPFTVINTCREPNGFGFPENNIVTYEFPGTQYTTETLKWIWYDGPESPVLNDDLLLPDGELLPEQGAMFIGEKGRLLLPHFMELPRHIVDGKYVEIDVDKYAQIGKLKSPIRDYDLESAAHYHQFVNACMGIEKCTAPFSYSARLTETILLGVIAGRFPNKKLHWNNESSSFDEAEANAFLDSPYRDF